MRLNKHKIETEVNEWWYSRCKRTHCRTCGNMHNTEPERSEQWAKIWEVIDREIGNKKRRKA